MQNKHLKKHKHINNINNNCRHQVIESLIMSLNYYDVGLLAHPCGSVQAERLIDLDFLLTILAFNDNENKMILDKTSIARDLILHDALVLSGVIKPSVSLPEAETLSLAVVCLV